MKIEEYLLETPEKMLQIINGSEQLFKLVVKEKIEQIIITGSGTSYHSGLQTQGILESLTKLQVDVYYPFQIKKQLLLRNSSNTLFIGISQGGSSYSTYDAMKIAKEANCIIASMAGTEKALIDEIADYKLTVNCGEEIVGAKTKGYYCTKLNLILLGLHLAKENNTITETEFLNEIKILQNGIGKISENFNKSIDWIEVNKDWLAETKDLRVIGTSEIYGDTLESALKLLETLRIPVTGYEFEEFIHGIYNAINEDSTIIILDTGVEERVEKLLKVLGQWTEHIYIIGNESKGNSKHLVLNTIDHKLYKSLDIILPIQLICAKIPPLKNINPSIPKDPEFHKKLGSKKIN